MPSGRTHLRIEAALLFGWTALAGYLLARRGVTVEGVVAFVLAYAVSMLFLSPDLDLARSRASKRWGIARPLWLPYALLFRHRGVSHHPIFGPLTRVMYLGGICVVAVLILATAIGRPTRIPIPSIEIVLGAVAGLYAPNVAHIAADRLASAWRTRHRRRRL